MLRALLIYLSRAAWARNVVLHWGLARRVARRFVAGETQAEALAVVKQLQAKGITATVDILGESVVEAEQTRQTARSYCELLEAICQADLSAEVSLKLTALGIDIDPTLCRENLRAILEKARACGLTVTIDMEDSPYTQRTLDLFRALRNEEGFTNLRTVIQSYLYRSQEDVQALIAEGAGLRLCKGAYKEPPHLAYPRKRDVDAAYVRLAEALLAAAAQGQGYPAFATHDEEMIAAVKAYATEHGIPPDRFEFQMLYGVRPALQEQLIAEGYRMRVYVPFGTQWYPYFMRRLAERPANLWFFVSNFFRR